MTPYDIANSDMLKTQLQETGEFLIWPASDTIDQYVDAARALAHDLGLSADEIAIHMLKPSGRLWVRVKP